MTETGEIPEIPKADTLILFMGLHRLESLLPALYAAGYSQKTPCAAIQDGTLPSQRTLRASLEALGKACAQAGFDSPTLLVLGEVTNLDPS
jgi:uroporphyrin-III C-methyltransferase